MPKHCPICESVLPEAATSTSPFCSARCKLVDLGNWLGDRYVIAGRAEDERELRDEDLLALLREIDLQ